MDYVHGGGKYFHIAVCWLTHSFNKFVGLGLVLMVSGLGHDLGLEVVWPWLSSIRRCCTVMCVVQNARLKNLNEREKRQDELSNARYII